MRDALGDGYTETVRTVHSDIAESSDFVMYWWNHAAELVAQGHIQRFGFVTTNSLRQTFNRRVLERWMQTADKSGTGILPVSHGRDAHATKRSAGGPEERGSPISLHYAIPDHPWVDDGAAVRIAMTVAAPGDSPGLLQTVTAEHDEGTDGYRVELQSKTGKICADLTIGADVAGAARLQANEGLASEGVKPHGMGFVLTQEEAAGLGYDADPSISTVIKPYLNGRDLTAQSRNVLIIDLFSRTEKEVLNKYPAIYQWVLERVKPDRDAKAGRSKDADQYAKEWWLFGKTRGAMRAALAGLSRYIVTVKTAKHRTFLFVDQAVIPDSKLIAIAFDDAFFLGVLSSSIHSTWLAANQSFLEDRPTYVIGTCFNKFPFPDATPEQQERIRELAEQLDAHRKRRQAQHPDLTMTGMYNVLEKLRSGEPLTAKDKAIHEHGLVSVLKQLHDDLDRAVAAAYGFPAELDDESILERLVALNQQRAAEEAQGQIRYLRPAYQNPDAAKAAQSQIALGDEPTAHRSPTTAHRPETTGPWPKTLPEQMRALTVCIQTAGRPLDLATITKAFKGARKPKVQEILDALTDLGRLTQTDDGHWQG